MSRFVLDCSVAVSWCFPDEMDSYAASVRDSLEEHQALTPPIWILEFANALVVAERRGRITPSDTAAYVSALMCLPILTDDADTKAAASRLLHIARSRGLSAYDASYVETAKRLGLPLATLDNRLKSAARDEGIELYQPPA